MMRIQAGDKVDKVGRGLTMVSMAAALAAASAQQPQTVPVVVAEATEERFVDRIEALGTLRANESVDLTANVTETVIGIGFEDNQRVEKGHVLVEMVSAEEEALIVEARSNAYEAKQQFDRANQLAQSGASSQADLDQARRIHETAKARLAAIESHLRDLVVVAPFDGVVGLRNISVGAQVRPGDLITTIDDDSVMKLDFSVPSAFLPVMLPGTEIQARARAYDDEVFKGEITSVGSRIDPVTRSVVVRAKLPNEDRRLKPGLLMTVDILSNPRKALAIPEEAVIARGATKSVFVLDESTTPPTLAKREVTTGTRRAGDVEILEGLEAGDKVVTRGAMTATPGATAEVMAVADGSETLRELIGAQDTAKDTAQDTGR